MFGCPRLDCIIVGEEIIGKRNRGLCAFLDADVRARLFELVMENGRVSSGNFDRIFFVSICPPQQQIGVIYLTLVGQAVSSNCAAYTSWDRIRTIFTICCNYKIEHL